MTGEGAPDSVAILAGSGRLPAALAERIRGTGRPCRLLALRGFSDRDVAAGADAVVAMLDVAGALARLAAWRPGCVTLAGGVARPRLGSALDAFSFVRSRAEIGRLMARGDDDLLRGVVALLEEHGHRVVGVHDLAPDLLAPSGCLGRVRPEPADERAVALGFDLLGRLSPFDIGQAAILRGERVLAVEGPEGTDAALARVRRLQPRWQRRERGGVLVKGPKQGQDLRVDLPAIGPRTIRNARAAGLAGVAVASGATLILEEKETVRLADRLGLFLVGVPAGTGRP